MEASGVSAVNCERVADRSETQSGWWPAQLFRCFFPPECGVSVNRHDVTNYPSAANFMLHPAPEASQLGSQGDIGGAQFPSDIQSIHNECHSETGAQMWSPLCCCMPCSADCDEGIDGFQANRADECTTIMYHGTSTHHADSIERHGFCQSKDGMLGAGVYCSRNVLKALPYARKWDAADGGVVFELQVTLGRVAVIDQHGHPLQKSWHDHGFDCAWVPPHTMNRSGMEEHCVWDPAHVIPVRRLTPAECSQAAQRTGRPRQNCMPKMSLNRFLSACWRSIQKIANSCRSLASRFLRFIRVMPAHRPEPPRDLPSHLPLFRRRPPGIAAATANCNRLRLQNRASLNFWSRCFRAIKSFGMTAVATVVLICRAAVDASVYVAARCGAALKVAASGLRSLLGALLSSRTTTPSLRSNRVQPAATATHPQPSPPASKPD